MTSEIFKDFYFNLIPGCCLLFYWLLQDQTNAPKAIAFFQSNNYETIGVIAFFAVGLALGIFFHGVFRSIVYIIRWTIRKIVNRYKNDCDNFYKHNAVLWAKKMRDLPEFFSSRASIWGSLEVEIAFVWFILGIRKDLYIWYSSLIIVFNIMYLIDRSKEEKSANEIYDNLKNKLI